MIKIFKNIKSLFLITGIYLANDDEGNKLLINIDYSNNKYGLSNLTRNSESSKLLKNESEKLAKDLLIRKSRINLVK